MKHLTYEYMLYDMIISHLIHAYDMIISHLIHAYDMIISHLTHAYDFHQDRIGTYKYMYTL